MSDQRELLHLQNNANGHDKQSSSQLIEREEVEGTRFLIVGNQETGYIVTLGKYQVTEYQQSKEDCREAIKNKDWDIIWAVAAIASQTAYEELIREKYAKQSEKI